MIREKQKEEERGEEEGCVCKYVLLFGRGLNSLDAFWRPGEHARSLSHSATVYNNKAERQQLLGASDGFCGQNLALQEDCKHRKKSRCNPMYN